MPDPHMSITLTFRTPAPTLAILENVLAALNRHGIPHELTGTNSHSFDLDEVGD
jgi:hypothetical protein